MQLRQAVDNLYLYDPEFEPGANRFRSEVGGSTAVQAVRCWADLKTVAQQYTGVRFLVMDTHGVPGAVHRADGSQHQGLDFMLLDAHPGFLQKDARLLFLGCNVGEGEPGDLFLDEVGEYLLRRRGGIVGATTVANVSFQLGPFSSEAYMMPLSFGRLKVRRYDAQGRQVGSRTVDRHALQR